MAEPGRHTEVVEHEVEKIANDHVHEGRAGARCTLFTHTMLYRRLIATLKHAQCFAEIAPAVASRNGAAGRHEVRCVEAAQCHSHCLIQLLGPCVTSSGAFR